MRKNAWSVGMPLITPVEMHSYTRAKRMPGVLDAVVIAGGKPD